MRLFRRKKIYTRLSSNQMCACLLETGSRRVEIVERCLRCGACMNSDAYSDLQEALSDAMGAVIWFSGMKIPEEAWESWEKIRDEQMPRWNKLLED